MEQGRMDLRRHGGWSETVLDLFENLIYLVSMCKHRPTTYEYIQWNVMDGTTETDFRVPKGVVTDNAIT